MDDLIKSMYLENRCAVKLETKKLNSSPKEELFVKVLLLRLTLFNVYINDLPVQLNQCAAPGHLLLYREVKSVFMLMILFCFLVLKKDNSNS